MAKKKDIALSASILAYELGCSVHDLKERLFEQFDSEPPQPEKLELLLYFERFSEAMSLGMHQDDTPAAIRLVIMHEYLSTHCFLVEDNPDLFDELYVGSDIGDAKYINELLSDQLDIPIRHHESLTDNCAGMNSRKIINMDELITSLYQLCIQEIEQINNYEQLSKDGKFEAFIFMSSITLDPEFYFELPFSEILDEFLAIMNNYAIENGIKIDISNLTKFIRERQLFYFIEVAKTRNPDYVLKEVFATLFERPLLSEREFIINNLDNSLLSENKLPKSVMVDFTNYLKSEVIHFVKSEVKLILSKYK